MDENFKTVNEKLSSESLDDNGSTKQVSGAESSNPVNASSKQPVTNHSNDQIKPSKGLVKKVIHVKEKVNIFLLLIIFIIVVVTVIVAVVYIQGKNNNSLHFKSQGLSQSVLQQLARSDTSVGSNQSILHVEASSIFDSQVFFKQSVGVAGNLQVGGSTNSSSLNVSGTSQLQQTEINKNLDVAGNVAIQGSTTITSSLQVSGSATFSGSVSAPQFTTNDLALNGDLTLTHHIITSGGIPSKTPGTALGGGGSVSISGDDISGTVVINAGNSPAAGCYATITFTKPYPSTPHILLTPIGSASGGLSYYVNRSNSNFSICSNSAAPAGSSISYDYFVID